MKWPWRRGRHRILWTRQDLAAESASTSLPRHAVTSLTARRHTRREERHRRTRGGRRSARRLRRRRLLRRKERRTRHRRHSERHASVTTASRSSTSSRSLLTSTTFEFRWGLLRAKLPHLIRMTHWYNCSKRHIFLFRHLHLCYTFRHTISLLDWLIDF
jgi:hypothetical protein